jgi:hypothetical protein
MSQLGPYDGTSHTPYNLLKDLAQDCDLLRHRLDEELIAKVSRSEPLVVCALFMRRSGRKLVIP